MTTNVSTNKEKFDRSAVRINRSLHDFYQFFFWLKTPHPVNQLPVEYHDVCAEKGLDLF